MTATQQPLLVLYLLFANHISVAKSKNSQHLHIIETQHGLELGQGQVRDIARWMILQQVLTTCKHPHVNMLTLLDFDFQGWFYLTAAEIWGVTEPAADMIRIDINCNLSDQLIKISRNRCLKDILLSFHRLRKLSANVVKRCGLF